MSSEGIGGEQTEIDPGVLMSSEGIGGEQTEVDPGVLDSNNEDKLKIKQDEVEGEVKAPEAMFKQPALSSASSDAAECADIIKKEESKDEGSEGSLEPKPVVDNAKGGPPLSYKEPSWGGTCSQSYILEVIKNGVAVREISLSTKPYWVIGRLAQCDIPMEHPSLSRYHAVIQYCTLPTDKHPVGWYLYDLGSTHGTILNKSKVTAQTYHRLRVGYTFKFGGSSRLHILQGPDDDQEIELTPEDLTALREKRKAQLEEKLKVKAESENKQLNDGSGNERDGCSWGLDDDAEDIDPDAVNPFASEVTEELQLDDPKKTLRGWFEREGYDEPEYIIEEKSHGVHLCTVDLPVDTLTGHPMKAQVSVQGKKKEAVIQCAMEACKILDKQGILRQAKHESRKRKVKSWADNDFYDSDDDTFLDRTGDIEKKRKLRMERAGKLEEKKEVVTYDKLVEELLNIENEMKEIQDKLDRTKKLEKNRAADMDDLDAYMMSIKTGGMNATEKTKCKRRMIELKTEKLRTEKLINIAKPNSLQGLRKNWQIESKSKVPRSADSNQQLPSKSAESSSPQSLSGSLVTVHHTTVAPSNSHSTQDTEIARDPDSTSIITHKAPDTATQPAVKRTQQTPDTATQPAVKRTQQTPDTATQPAVKRTQQTPDTSTQPAVKRTQQTPDTSTQPTIKRKQQAPAGGSLAGMVTDLKNKAEEEEFLNDPDHITWMPPKGQSGDGKTRLNDKFGY